MTRKFRWSSPGRIEKLGSGARQKSARLPAPAANGKSSRSPSSSRWLDFTVSGGTFGESTGANNPRVTFTTAAPALDDGILAYATINGADFATYGANGIAAATHSASNQNSWSGSTNYSTTSDLALTASRNLNSLRLAAGADLNLGGHQLSVESGGVPTTGPFGTVISNGLLTTNNANKLVVHAHDTGGTTISTVIAAPAAWSNPASKPSPFPAPRPTPTPAPPP